MKIGPDDLPDLAKSFTDLLGTAWTIDPDASTYGVALLDGPDGRRAGIRTRRGGTTLQLWVTGYRAPVLPRNADQTTRNAHARHLAERLEEGANYHTVLRLAEVDEPAKAVLDSFDEVLFPAFDHKPLAVGHRPWLDAAEAAEAARAAERPNLDAPTDTEPAAPTAPAAPTEPATSTETDSKPARAPRKRTAKPPADTTPAPAKASRPRKVTATKADPPKPRAKRTAKEPATN
ncbi:hypothetical protein [Kitasatospora sp. MBT63]|uniref:hypothetical protein n=1 Tax=Kitasatospora sp. MBT63 TaxID=1444768 RepID=UPI00053A0691|nr:hypothetical protein [Kitasatospora sp. MBT63]